MEIGSIASGLSSRTGSSAPGSGAKARVAGGLRIAGKTPEEASASATAEKAERALAKAKPEAAFEDKLAKRLEGAKGGNPKFASKLEAALNAASVKIAADFGAEAGEGFRSALLEVTASGAAESAIAKTVGYFARDLALTEGGALDFRQRLGGLADHLFDPRVTGRAKYLLCDLLAIIFVATMAGYYGRHAIAFFAGANGNVIMKALTMTDIPCQDTFARAVAVLNQDQFRYLFTELAVECYKKALDRGRGRPKTPAVPDVIALDGKTITGSVPRGGKKSDVHIVNAVLSFLTLAFHRVSKKSNEIASFPLLLEVLNKHKLLRGKVVTIDAMGRRKSLAALILSYGANRLFGLKGNQGNLLKRVKALFTDNWLSEHPDIFRVGRYSTDYRIQGGRIERRLVTVVYLNDEAARKFLPEAAKWAGIKTLIMVERIVLERAVKGKLQPGTSGIGFRLSSLALPPERMRQVVLKRRSVETIHGRLDAGMSEDKRGISRGPAPEALTGFKKLNLNIINSVRRLWPGVSVWMITTLANVNPTFREAILTRKPRDVGDPRKWLKLMREVRVEYPDPATFRKAG